MSPRRFAFLQAGSSCAIEIERPAKQPARDLHDSDRKRQLQPRPLHLESVDMTTTEGRFRLHFWAGNQIAAAIHGR